MMYFRVISLSQTEVQEFDKSLTAVPHNDIVFCKKISFENGYRMEIRSHSKGYTSNWIQAFLISDKDEEISHTVPVKTYMGSWSLPHNNDLYKVFVTLKNTKRYI